MNSAGAAKRRAPEGLNPEALHAAKGVRMNAVNLGLTLTDCLQEGMATDARAQGISPEEAMQRANTRIPMGRIAKPEEVADAVVYLASVRTS